MNINLLFITRKVDRGDPRVGFVHSWINEMNAELRRRDADGRGKLFILCQEKGDVSELSVGIEVFSMGKEFGYGRLRQWWEIQKVLWKNRDRLDVVFVHMMPMYAIAAGIFCKIFGKPLYLWYVHKAVDWRLRFTQLFVKGYFTASKESFRMKTRKLVFVVGHGIDVNRFQVQNHYSVIASDPDVASGERGNLVQTREMRLLRRKPSRNDDSIHLLTVGRISPVKNIHVMIDVVKALVTRGKDATLTIVGEPALERDHEYYRVLWDQAKNLGGSIIFAGAKSQDEVVSYYQSADIFLNFSETGSLDKSVLEAMACGCPVLTSNEAFREELKEFPQYFIRGGNYDQTFVAAATERLIEFSKMSNEELNQKGFALRERVVGHHSLANLMKRVVSIIA